MSEKLKPGDKVRDKRNGREHEVIEDELVRVRTRDGVIDRLFRADLEKVQTPELPELPPHIAQLFEIDGYRMRVPIAGEWYVDDDWRWPNWEDGTTRSADTYWILKPRIRGDAAQAQRVAELEAELRAAHVEVRRLRARVAELEAQANPVPVGETKENETFLGPFRLFRVGNAFEVVGDWDKGTIFSSCHLDDDPAARWITAALNACSGASAEELENLGFAGFNRKRDRLKEENRKLTERVRDGEARISALISDNDALRERLTTAGTFDSSAQANQPEPVPPQVDCGTFTEAMHAPSQPSSGYELRRIGKLLGAILDRMPDAKERRNHLMMTLTMATWGSPMSADERIEVMEKIMATIEKGDANVAS